MSSDLRELLQSSLGSGYRLSRELGGGGMAKVYVADDPAVGRRVVVKVLSPDLAAGVNIDRFKREIQVAVSLHHPRIVPVLSAGQSGDDLLYYTMPYIEGETLRALIERECQLPLDRALAIAHDVAEALEYAHGRNIVHRDIKPENILIERETGRAVVTDFGIARAIERAADITTVTSTGLTLGTPTYMSPEQAGAEKYVDGRSDIYSLGCVLFEMLAGTPPFTAPTARAIIARHMTEPPPPIRVVRPDLSVGVSRLLEMMLAKVPAGRFRDATTLIGAIDAPDSLPEPRPMGRGIGKSRAAIGVGLALLLAVAALLARPKRAGTPSAADPAKIAVLYFDALPTDTLLVTIARGVTRDLIYALERVPELRLISEAGIRKFTPHAPVDSIARALDVGTVVLGSIERFGSDMQVDVRLVDAPTLVDKGAVRGRYPISMVPGMRDSVVHEVARQLLRRIGKEQQLRDWIASTPSAHAWQLRQHAEDLLENEQELPRRPADFTPQLSILVRAESLLVAAADADRSWPEPLIERGWVQFRRSRYAPDDRKRAILDSASRLASATVARWPENARALGLLGYLEYQRWSGLLKGGNPTLGDSAERDLRAATTIDPHLARAWGALSYVLELKGDTVGALAAARRALDVDPYERDAGSTMVRLVFHYLYDRQYDSARVLCARARLRFPGDAYVDSCELSVLGWSGAGEKDLAQLELALRRTEASGSWPLSGGMFPVGRFWLAAVLARSGQRESASAVLRETRATLQRVGHGMDHLVNEAQVLVVLGENERALDLLEQAVRIDPAMRARIGRTPWFDALRQSPRFARLTQADVPPSTR